MFGETNEEIFILTFKISFENCEMLNVVSIQNYLNHNYYFRKGLFYFNFLTNMGKMNAIIGSKLVYCLKLMKNTQSSNLIILRDCKSWLCSSCMFYKTVYVPAPG